MSGMSGVREIMLVSRQELFVPCCKQSWFRYFGLLSNYQKNEPWVTMPGMMTRLVVTMNLSLAVVTRLLMPCTARHLSSQNSWRNFCSHPSLIWDSASKQPLRTRNRTNKQLFRTRDSGSKQLLSTRDSTSKLLLITRDSTSKIVVHIWHYISETAIVIITTHPHCEMII